jgi:hypothetical protein
MGQPAVGVNAEFETGLESLGLDASKGKSNGKAPIDPKANYITIHVDEETGQSNYLPVGVNGKIYKIMRGVDVSVPPEVVEVLRNAIAHRLVQTTNPVTGLIDSVEQAYSPYPWRVVYIPR